MTRYIVTRRNGSLEDWGADEVRFGQTHVLFLDKGKITHAVHADEIREMAVEDEDGE